MAVKTYEHSGVVIQMVDHFTLRASILDEELRLAVPEAATWKGRRHVLFENFVTFLGVLVDIQGASEDPDAQALLSWWATYRQLTSLRQMWIDWLGLTPQMSNLLLVDAYTNTRRTVVPPPEELAPGAGKRAQEDADFLADDEASSGS